jgi:flagellar biosynthesis chaperone FliJ
LSTYAEAEAEIAALSKTNRELGAAADNLSARLVAAQKELAEYRELKRNRCEDHQGARMACGQCFDSQAQHLSNARADADVLERDLAEARRELAESRRIWHEKRDELQTFADGLALQLSAAVSDTTRAKDNLASALKANDALKQELDVCGCEQVVAGSGWANVRALNAEVSLIALRAAAKKVQAYLDGGPMVTFDKGEQQAWDAAVKP